MKEQSEGPPQWWRVAWHRLMVKLFSRRRSRKPQRPNATAHVRAEGGKPTCLHGKFLGIETCADCREMIEELIHANPQNPRKG